MPPADIRSVAVTVDDLVSALEARLRTDRPVVLRVTAPFAPRERARLHVADDSNDHDGLHLDPERFVADDAPRYPSVDATEDRLREAGVYSVENHRRAHAAAVEAWRETVREHFRETVTVETGDGTVEVAVSYLG